MRGALTFTRISLLHRPKPDGALLGYYDGEPIAAAVLDEFSRRYLYAGVGPHRRNGKVDEESLHPGEWLTESGLICRSEEWQARHKTRSPAF